MDKKYDIEERTANFGVKVLMFCKNTLRNEINKPLIQQLIRSATSVGANYMEASAASSRKDFINKICICKKEAKETMHWLRMLSSLYEEDTKQLLRLLWKEAHELSLIFGSISKSKRVL